MEKSNTSVWRPSATIKTLQHRARLLGEIRDFFSDRGYLEVETPILGRYGVTEPYLSNIKAYLQGEDYYLQTSPEYHMKRLLAAGSGPIFQIARVFRDDELGRWHNPEFTLLEWYRLESDHFQLMDEVDQFLQRCLGCQPLVRQSYQAAFQDICNIDPFDKTMTLKSLQDCVVSFGLGDVLPEDEVEVDPYLFLLMSHVIEPALAKIESPVVIYHFPPSQASLAKVKNGVAERFEVYYRGVELANGFHELTDPILQSKRFSADVHTRQMRDLNFMAPDQYLLQALEHGLPSCSGIALGVDRLLTLRLKHDTIATGLAFDFQRA